MNDEGEKTCPLCAEEMDLTDQQLKPCKCGYEICVWCWNHIMEMAEKDETEGRCPACRTPYDRERIVGTAANCERVLAEVHIERKQKSQKAKIKNSESRKQLSSVRVIQRNLVYVVGLPLNLADEDLLQRKEYFGQYGNVLKVSVSRTSAGSIQQFANNTCSVYITYSKEEEAVRCIQSAHGFILDGRPLRACFGTTKYCHAWLRNVPCNNPDCLYLHEIGSQEDSFAKDETISAYTRNRVQQITGCTSNTQRRSGMALPAPTDDYCNNNSPVTGKAVAKNSSNVPALSVKCSPPSSCSVRSGVLQSAALWESRASNSTPPGSLACSTGPVKQKADVNGLAAISTVVSYNTEASILPNHDGKKCLSEDTRAVQSKNKLEVLQTEQHGVHSDAKGSEVSATLSSAPVLKLGNQSPRPPAAENDNAESCLLVDAAALSGGPSSGVEKGRIPFADEKIQNLCSEMSTMGLDKRTKEHSDIVRRSSLCLDTYRLPAGRGVQWHDSEKLHDVSISAVATTAAGTVDSVNTSTEVCDWKSYVQDHEVHKLPSQTEDDFDNQRLRDAVLVKQATMSASQHLLGHLKNPLQEHAATADVVDYAVNSAASTRKPNEGFETNVPDEFLNNYVSCASVQGFLGSPFNVGQENCIGGFDHGLPNLDSQSAMDLGESSIISNILDLDSWDDSLTSPQNLAKFLGKSDKSEVPVKLANSWKGQICNQSRFSFARQEELRNHLFDFESSLNNIVQGDKDQSFGKSFIENRGRYLDIIGNGFGFSQHTEKSDNLRSSHSALQSSKLALTRSQISAPPGFSVPSRPPPPGFSSHERIDQAFDLKSGNHLLESSSLLRNPYQASPGGNINAASDIELMDPAILAVGEGRLPTGVNNSGMDMRPNIHVQAPLFENDSRLQLLMQRSLSHRQSLRCTKVGDNFCSVSDDYGFTSQQHMGESQRSNLSLFTPFSLHQTRNMVATNGHWNAWSEIQTGNDLRVAELLRNDRLRFNKFGMTSSGDLYNKSFKM